MKVDVEVKTQSGRSSITQSPHRNLHTTIYLIHCKKNGENGALETFSEECFSGRMIAAWI